MFRFASCLFAVLALTTTPALATPLKVVASFSILGDMASDIGGDKIDLTVLVGADGDTHSFEPAPKDAKALHEADLIIMNGLHLESWMDKLARAANATAPIIVASAGVTPLTMSEHDHDEHDDNEAHHDADHADLIPDPHAWQDLTNGAIYVRNIEAALIKADPQNAQTYKANAASLLAKLAELDAWTRQQIATVPADKRKIITTHDAFGYFGTAYGVTFLAPTGLSTDAEPGAGSLGALIDQIKADNISALFIENMSDPRLMTTIQRETGAELGGELYSDALSSADGPAPTYAAMFANNVPKLVTGMLKNK
jgi:zinc/manganese transport system substrate-binding protein